MMASTGFEMIPPLSIVRNMKSKGGCSALRPWPNVSGGIFSDPHQLKLDFDATEVRHVCQSSSVRHCGRADLLLLAFDDPRAIVLSRAGGDAGAGTRAG